MVFLAVVLGAAVLCCSVLLVFGCVCHLFKRHGFTNFEDEESVRDVSMYPTNESVHDSSNVTFEPLPDILAKTLSSRALRPRITCTDKEKQSAAAKLVTIYKTFPRNQLLYIKEIGLGWFGQVLQGSAENILPDSRHIKVVVKILKDDATANEKALFLEEVAPYRDLDHPNIIKLLGQCTETTPFLTIAEYPPMGDLKSYLLTNKTGPFIQLAIDAAKALSYMHKHSYIHHDFAARNCLLMSDLTLKVGDYGIGEDLYREDYYDTGRDLLPIRWMSPESLEVKQGVWQLKEFTIQSNVWSLSVLLWEIVCGGRRPYINLRDEDVLQKVIRDGTAKLPCPSADVPLHDRWFEIMEMCWQEIDDRPTTDDILAFLQQIEEELTSESHDQTAVTSSEPLTQTGPQSPTSFDSKFVMSKNVNQSNQHVAEVLVHRVDDSGQRLGFDDDFSKSVKIQKNKNGGFEDDFIHVEENANDTSYLSQNDSILAYGGNNSEIDKDIFSPDQNLNLQHPPVPVGMSTPSKYLTNGKTNLSEGYNTAMSNTTALNSKYVTAQDGNLHVSAFNPDLVRSNSQSISPFNPDFIRSDNRSKQSSKQIFAEKSDHQSSDDGYRTGMSNSAPDIVLNNHSDTGLSKQKDDISNDNDLNEDLDEVQPYTRLSPKFSDLETEKAKEIYMSKGAGLPTSIVHKSRSLGTIPEDGIPSDNTSQSGVVFDDPESDIGMNFEWDDYEGEQLVGHVRHMSDESVSSTRSPRHVEVEEWPFDQDSSSESHSKPGSIASESDAEVTRLSMESNTSIDTRARIASILTNRLNSLIKQTNSPHSGQGMFYSFSNYDNDLDSPEHAFTDTDHPLGKASVYPDEEAVLSMPSGNQSREAIELSDESLSQGQDFEWDI
ncbi:insulin-like receptor isoform X2 [Ruditapes philippinarum]|uniref:insulin-like receptor isoform X2 n=1 Tax=Ruditapes philippinarum TaxID=129788 RepID=UPI00295A7FB1|nr:insulin-like receptor isoform X2 [Ruditapes philippinarum]